MSTSPGDRATAVAPSRPGPATVAGRPAAAAHAPESTTSAGLAARLGRRAAALRLSAALLSGLLLYLAFPPADLPWLAPPALAVLVLACRGATARQGALLGLVHGLALFLPLVEWTATLAGVGALVLLSLAQAAFLALLGAALAVVTRTPGWPVWSAALWVGEEALRTRLPFGGFPWGRLAFSQGDTWLTPLAALGGAPLVTFAVALLGGVLAWVLVHGRTAPALAAVVALATLAGTGGAAALVPAVDDGERVPVAVIQGNVPRLGLDFNAQRAAVLANHITATRELADDVRAGRAEQPALVVWPENASDIDPFVNAEAYEAIDAAVRDIGVPVLVGAVLQGPGEYVSNTGIVWDPETGPGERYVKRHPVPFGEYIPYRWLVSRVTSKVDLVPRDFVQGDEVGVLDVGPVRLGDVICFEVGYDGLVRDVVTGGGRLLVVQTNNATFGRSAQTEQQLAMGRLRAVEHGRTVLVAATSGVSAIIAPDGELVDTAPVFTRRVLTHDVLVRDDLTLASRVGVAPEAALAALGALALAVPALLRRRAG